MVTFWNNDWQGSQAAQLPVSTLLHLWRKIQLLPKDFRLHAGALDLSATAHHCHVGHQNQPQRSNKTNLWARDGSYLKFFFFFFWWRIMPKIFKSQAFVGSWGWCDSYINVKGHSPWVIFQQQPTSINYRRYCLHCNSCSAKGLLIH